MSHVDLWWASDLGDLGLGGGGVHVVTVLQRFALRRGQQKRWDGGFQGCGCSFSGGEGDGTVLGL